MIAPVQLFNQGPSQITDFGKISSGDIFNRTVIPTHDIFQPQSQEDQFLSQVRQPPVASSVNEPQVNYDEPVAQTQPVVAVQEYPAQAQAPTQGQGDMNIKLSNYGYDSDSSPDYNSNVARIGHANNKLEDGLSAALSKSLASRLGLKTGDMFEATTAGGEVLKRRYDDTVPSTYRGRALPETVDLFEIGGNNSFGGSITGIKKL